MVGGHGLTTDVSKKGVRGDPSRRQALFSSE